jgi:hypothetical protein
MKTGTVKAKVKVNVAKAKAKVKVKVAALVDLVFLGPWGIVPQMEKEAKASFVGPTLETQSFTPTSTFPILRTIGLNMTTTQHLLPSLLRKLRSWMAKSLLVLNDLLRPQNTNKTAPTCADFVTSCSARQVPLFLRFLLTHSQKPRCLRARPTLSSLVRPPVLPRNRHLGLPM